MALFDSMPDVLPQLRDNRLRVLAMAPSSDRRWRRYPDLHRGRASRLYVDRLVWPGCAGEHSSGCRCIAACRDSQGTRRAGRAQALCNDRIAPDRKLARGTRSADLSRHRKIRRGGTGGEYPENKRGDLSMRKNPFGLGNWALEQCSSCRFAPAAASFNPTFDEVKAEHAIHSPVGWVEPTGPAFGRPDDRLRETYHRVARDL